MKSLSFTILLFLLSYCPLAMASEQDSFARKRLFHCRNFGPNEEVEELFIVRVQKGSRTTYEVEVPYGPLNEKKIFTRSLNLISKYDGRVLLYTTGNYRVKIDRVFPVEKKYKTFVRLPKFDVHSTQWFCKDY
jgi:hypothetical protein